MLDELLIVLIRGVGAGAIYALVGMSFNVAYSATHILNFAQGNFFVLGGFIAVMFAGLFASWTPELWFIGLPLSAVVVAALLAFQGWITLLPLRYSVEQYSWIISTMAVSTIIGALLLIFKGPWSQTASSPFPSVPTFGYMTPAPYIIAIVLMIFWYVALTWFLRKTMTGLAISAISQDLEAARAAGLRVRRLQIISFAISGLIIGSAGYAVAPIISIAADTGFNYVLNGFIANVVGGLGSNIGALFGGPIVGVITVLVIYKIGAHYQYAASLLLLVAVLLLRPQGLFGRTAARRV